MVVSFKRSAGENGLDSRIAQLSSRPARIDENSRAPVEVPENPPEPSSELASTSTADSLPAAREELIARLCAGTSPSPQPRLRPSERCNIFHSTGPNSLRHRAS